MRSDIRPVTDEGVAHLCESGWSRDRFGRTLSKVYG
jgi:hypothetical protein